MMQRIGLTGQAGPEPVEAVCAVAAGTTDNNIAARHAILATVAAHACSMRPLLFASIVNTACLRPCNHYGRNKARPYAAHHALQDGLLLCQPGTGLVPIPEN